MRASGNPTKVGGVHCTMGLGRVDYASVDIAPLMFGPHEISKPLDFVLAVDSA